MNPAENTSANQEKITYVTEATAKTSAVHAASASIHHESVLTRAKKFAISPDTSIQLKKGITCELNEKFVQK